jgi:hypothetical protein
MARNINYLLLLSVRLVSILEISAKFYNTKFQDNPFTIPTDVKEENKSVFAAFHFEML